MNKMHGVVVKCGIVFLAGILTASGVLAKQKVASTQPTIYSNSTVSSASAQAANLEEIEAVNINTADAAALQKIKGFGKKKSLAVVDYRNKNGQFKSLEDLLKVESRGISKKWLAKVSKFLTL